MENNYTHPELIQTIGQLYMDLSRSQIVIRQLQQIFKDKDVLISQLTEQVNSLQQLMEPRCESGSEE